MCPVIMQTSVEATLRGTSVAAQMTGGGLLVGGSGRAQKVWPRLSVLCQLQPCHVSITISCEVACWCETMCGSQW